MINNDTETMKRQEGDQNMLSLNSKTLSQAGSHETPLSIRDIIDKTFSLTIQSENDIELNIIDIISFYQQIDHKLFDYKMKYSVIYSEQLYYDNIKQIRNQRIVLQSNNQSTILQGFIEATKQMIVQKIINVNCPQVLIQKLDEYKIQNFINHQYPLQSLQLITPVRIIKSDNNYQLVALLEKALFNLYDYSRRHKITAEQGYFICKIILEQIIDLHKLKIAHRDVKPQNILFIKDKDWLLSDFGESQQYEEIQSNYSIRGTKYFLPKIIQSQINQQKQINQNLLKNDLYALVVTIFMIRDNEYIKDIENLLINLPVNNYLSQILEIQSLENLIGFNNKMKMLMGVQFNLSLPILKIMTSIEEDSNKNYEQLSVICLYQYYQKLNINPLLCDQMLQLIDEWYPFTIVSPLDNVLRINNLNNKKMDPLQLARQMKYENYKFNEQIIISLFKFGYNQKTIFYINKFLSNIYSQQNHLILIQCYQRISMLEEVDQEIIQFNQGLMFDQINTKVQQQYIYIWNEYLRFKSGSMDQNLLQNQEIYLLNLFIFIDQVTKQFTQSSLQDNKTTVDLILGEFEKLCSNFSLINQQIYSFALRKIEESLTIGIYMKIIKKILRFQSDLVDLNRKVMLVYVLGQLRIYLNHYDKLRQYYKLFKLIILKSDGWQQIVSFKIYKHVLEIFSKQKLIHKILTKIRLQIKIADSIKVKLYKLLIMQNLLHLIQILNNSCERQYNSNIILIIKYSIQLAFEQQYHKSKLANFNIYHTQGQELLLELKNSKRCQEFIKEYKDILSYDSIQYKCRHLHHKWVYGYLNSKQGRCRQYLIEQYLNQQ